MHQSVPPGHRWVLTDDGTPTLHSERFSESCHSSAGAVLETRLHYLTGCELPQLMAKNALVRVLEVGFGTGLGWRETAALAANFPHSQLEFVSLELDEELVRWALPNGRRGEDLGKVCYEAQLPGAKLKVLIGDARLTLPYWAPLLGPFDAIYQDAFSPRRNPTLWSRQWFALLGSLAKPGARLSTYSAGIAIRKALHEAGWGVRVGEGFGPKKASTRARWQETSDAALLTELQKHPTPALVDPEIL